MGSAMRFDKAWTPEELFEAKAGILTTTTQQTFIVTESHTNIME